MLNSTSVSGVGKLKVWRIKSAETLAATLAATGAVRQGVQCDTIGRAIPAEQSVFCAITAARDIAVQLQELFGVRPLGMARIYPFRALRYNSSLVKPGDVVTQPFDKITPSMQQAYYKRSPFNLVRIICGLPELFDSEEQTDVYTRAARDLQAWRDEGVLVREPEPCVFAYSQRFIVPGLQTSAEPVAERRGFIALGELYDYSQRVVFRHEQTLAGPECDRLRLLDATRAHCEPIFMLYSDPARTVEKLLFSPAPVWDVEVTDEFGVLHRISRINDPGTINILLTEMEDKKLIIADGHHRYEAALDYAKKRRPDNIATSERNSYILPQPAYPEAAALMAFVNVDANAGPEPDAVADEAVPVAPSGGLVILAAHRVVHGLANYSTAELLRKAESYFQIEAMAETEAAEIQKKLAVAGRQGTAFVMASADGRYLLRANAEAIALALATIPERPRKLDAVQLHSLILEQLLGISQEAIREEKHVRYVRDLNDALEQISDGEANVAFLMNPTTLRQLREMALAGETMPQKSTDFYPKLLSGLAIYALD